MTWYYGKHIDLLRSSGCYPNGDGTWKTPDDRDIDEYEALLFAVAVEAGQDSTTASL